MKAELLTILLAELKNKDNSSQAAPMIGDVVNVRVIENLNQIIIINPPGVDSMVYSQSITN